MLYTCEELRELRKKLTLQQIADKLNLSYSTIQKIIRRCENRSKDKINKPWSEDRKQSCSKKIIEFWSKLTNQDKQKKAQNYYRDYESTIKPPSRKSKFVYEFAQLLSSKYKNLTYHTREINSQQVVCDIYIPSHKLIIEIESKFYQDNYAEEKLIRRKDKQSIMILGGYKVIHILYKHTPRKYKRLQWFNQIDVFIESKQQFYHIEDNS